MKPSMNLSSSRVPHLARAITDKQQSLRGVRSQCMWTNIDNASAKRHYATRGSRSQPPKKVVAKPVPLPGKPSVRSAPASESAEQSSSPALNQHNEIPKSPARGSTVKGLAYQALSDAHTKAEQRLKDTLSPKALTPEARIAQAEAQKAQAERRKQWYSGGSSFFAGVLGLYLFYSWTSFKRDLDEYNDRDDRLKQNEDVSDRWLRTDRNFDAEVDLSERFTFMKRKRRRLVRQAYGDVLEVSCGTGRNLELFDTRPYDAREDASSGRSNRHEITSLTFNDQSEVMIANAQRKWDEFQKKLPAVGKFKGNVNFVVGDAANPDVIKRPEGGFDTIVQSMGICSMAEPAKFLQHLGDLARQPSEPLKSRAIKVTQEVEDDHKGGRIFLLEHGRAYPGFGWLNRYLDTSAAMHADRYGCWYNKDIEKVIEQSGLEVESMKRYSFGTVWEIILRPRPRIPKS